jgi:hypothetical protein
MKKLLALSIALLSLNLYGAEKPIISTSGLEGWGKKNGVNISVSDFSKFDKTLDVKAIKNQVELKLRLAGINASDIATLDDIYIDVMPLPSQGRALYYVSVKPVRRMNFQYNGNTYTTGSSSIIYNGFAPVSYNVFLDRKMDELLLDYLKANPKPKEKKSLIEP